MKQNNSVFIFFFLSVLCCSLSAQEDLDRKKARNTILAFYKHYEADIQEQVNTVQLRIVSRKFGDQIANEFLSSPNKNDFFTTSNFTSNMTLDEIEAFKEKLKNKTLKYGFHNRKMIEKFKANEISSYFGGVSDLAIQEYYATYNTSTKAISLGKNSTIFPKDDLNQLNLILKSGITITTNDEFGVIFNNGEFQRDNITLNLGLSKLAKGFVNFKPSRGYDYLGIIEEHREAVVKAKIISKANAYIKNGFDTDANAIEVLNNPNTYDSADFSKSINEFAKAKQNVFYSETAEEEIKFIKNNSLYKSFETNWMTLNFNLPLGNQNVKSSTDTESSNTTSDNFNAWNANFSFNYLWKQPKGISYFVSPSISIKNNNNFLANGDTAVNFETIVDQGNNQQSVVGVSQVFAGNYDEFVTTSVKVDFASLFIAESIGLRFTAEQNFGKFDTFNYTVGIPIIVKTKAGKPVINLELQYRNNNGKNLYGIATSILLKNLMK